LLAAGLVPDETPILFGMTCTTPPPEVLDVEVRPANVEEVAAIASARGTPIAREPSTRRSTFAALVDGRVAGVGRAVDMRTASP
jgi:hypothetical protein